MRPTLLLLPLALAGCGVFFDQRPQLRFIGALTAPDPVSCPPSRANLLIREKEVTFAPDEGTWVLEGRAAADTLSASRSRPAADHKVYRTDLEARWSPAAVTGTYRTPRCTYAVNLKPY